MDYKLRLSMRLIGNVLLYRVLEQPEEVRGKGRLSVLEDGDDQWELYSDIDVGPEIQDQTIFLVRGGPKESDHRFAAWGYDTATIAAEAAGALRKLVKQFNLSRGYPNQEYAQGGWEIVE